MGQVDALNGAVTIQTWGTPAQQAHVRLSFTEVGAIDWSGAPWLVTLPAPTSGEVGRAPRLPRAAASFCVWKRMTTETSLCLVHCNKWRKIAPGWIMHAWVHFGQ